MGEEREIFRRESLERLSSPERLDQLLYVVKPQHWLFLATLAALLGLFVLWSVVGRIPVSAEGAAILVRPKKVVSFQTRAQGQVHALAVDVGHVVRKGDLLVTLRLNDLEKELELERAKLELFQGHSTELARLDRELEERELASLGEQRLRLEERMRALADMAERFRAKNEEYIRGQRENLETARRLSEELKAALEERHEAYVVLEREELVDQDAVVDARSRVIDSQLGLAELNVQDQALELRETSAEESYADRMDEVQAIRIQLGQIQLRELELEQRLRRDELARSSDQREIERRIALLQQRLASDGEVQSEFAGRVLEVTTAVGQQVAAGQALGKLEIEDPEAQLQSVAFLPVEDGKKVRSGQPIHVYPSIFARERFGGIVGHIVRVSEYPVTVEAAANEIGDREIARALMGGASRIQVQAELATDPATASGYSWTWGAGPSDPPVTAGTTALVRITVEERAPITFLLPFLRSWKE
jgi:HlyD family secretion protein